MTAEEFEALLRSELAKRDQAKRARLGDPAAYAAADAAFIAAVSEAAGIAPAEEVERTVRKGSRRARLNEDKAFGGTA